MYKWNFNKKCSCYWIWQPCQQSPGPSFMAFKTLQGLLYLAFIQQFSKSSRKEPWVENIRIKLHRLISDRNTSFAADQNHVTSCYNDRAVRWEVTYFYNSLHSPIHYSCWPVLRDLIYAAEIIITDDIHFCLNYNCQIFIFRPIATVKNTLIRWQW